MRGLATHAVRLFQQSTVEYAVPHTSADPSRSISPGYIYSKGVISKGALGASAERLDAITPPPFSRPIVHQW